MNLADLSKEKYISLETFRRNGQGVKAPVWVAGEDGKLYVWTQRTTWKVKRIRHNSQVKVAKCDMRGNVKGEWLMAQALVLDNHTDLKKMQQRLAAKYGLVFRLIERIGLRRIGHQKYVVIEISES